MFTKYTVSPKPFWVKLINKIRNKFSLSVTKSGILLSIQRLEVLMSRMGFRQSPLKKRTLRLKKIRLLHWLSLSTFSELWGLNKYGLEFSEKLFQCSNFCIKDRHWLKGLRQIQKKSPNRFSLTSIWWKSSTLPNKVICRQSISVVLIFSLISLLVWPH